MSKVQHTKKSNPGYTLTKFISDTHLWLGVASGVILFLVCLSGTALIFYTEILHTADKALYHVNYRKGQSTKALDELVLMLEAKNTGFQVSTVSVPADKNEAWLFSLIVKEKKLSKSMKQKTMSLKGRRHGFGSFRQYLVNPYNGKIQGSAETLTYKLLFFVMFLHRSLLLGEPGRITVGISTIIFVVLLISGLILWLPKRLKRWQNWKRGLTIKWDANWKRINHDLHNTLGFYSLILLFIMAMTGLYYSFGWYRTGWNKLTGTGSINSSMIKVKSQKPDVSFQKHATADRYLGSADRLFPYRGNLVLSIPPDSTGEVSLSKTRRGFFASAGADKASLDQYTAQVLKVERFSDKRLVQQITDMMYPIHSGGVFGLSTKILYFLACVIATSLPITGVIIWINKLKKKSRPN